jgi:hypothetical protein
MAPGRLRKDLEQLDGKQGERDQGRFVERMFEEVSGESILIDRLEAVRLSGVCANSFDKHVRPLLNERRIGRRVMFVRREVIRWLESGATGSGSSKTSVPGSTSAVSGTRGKTIRSRRAREILRKLEEQAPRSTPRLCPVDDM